METKKLWWVGLFAIAMAYVESAIVVYIRRIYGISDLIIDIPPFDPVLAPIEVGRELATLIMLLAVGWAVGKSLQSRLSFTFIIFGVWDIFYYIWLKLFIGWPNSLFSPDILFLIPLPWWGPVIAPVLIACLMVAGGILVVLSTDKGRKIRLSKIDWMTFIASVLILLYSFMEDALSIMPADVETLAQLRPISFNWSIYIIGLVIAGYAVLHTTWSGNQKEDL
ncbi:MAG: hypothetical protein XE04_1006 [Marinimicrobia bacterium 46_43]|nr:MAG: hypothetical protein XE04_1006 [Marinimicrobia bacterium 46_43]